MTPFVTSLAVLFLFLWLFTHAQFKKFRNLSNESAKDLEKRVNKLEESKSRYKSIVEHMNEAVAAIDSDHHIQYFNKPFRNIFSPAHDLREGMLFTDVVRHTLVNELVDLVLGSKKTKKSVIEIVGGNEKRTFEVQGVYIPFKDKNMVALVFYDLTEIKEAENMKREFITNASHQLKTPLTAIQGYAETLIEDEEMDAKVRASFIRKISIKSIEAADLVFKLLRLSKLESNVEEIQPVNIHIEKVIEELEKKFEAVLSKNKIQIVREQDDSIQIQTDLYLLQLVLENLLENAVKYSKPNGKVYFSSKEDNGKIQLDIRDEGIGIPEADQDRIFERFFRSHNAENHTQNGVGIGMAMVKSALDKMKGTLQITSSQGQGTTVHLTFPRSL